MRLLQSFVTVALFLAANYSTCAGDQPQTSDRLPPIATSGAVEIASIRIVREQDSDAVKDADLSNMQIELWLTQKGNGGKPNRYLVKLLELAPIEDDTGKVLSTKGRLKGIELLHGETNPRTSRMSRGKAGPIIGMTLDAPARQATRIKSIKGKASVSKSVLTRLRFENPEAINGKPLNHPQLKDFPIRASIDVEDDNTTLTLVMPHESDRLVDWGLERKFLPTRPFSESKDVEKGETVLKKVYKGDHSKRAFLTLSIAELTETKTLEFEFKNVELP